MCGFLFMKVLKKFADNSLFNKNKINFLHFYQADKKGVLNDIDCTILFHKREHRIMNPRSLQTPRKAYVD